MESVRSRNLAEASRFQEEEFARKADHAERRAKEARRKGLPRGRWDAESRHWSSEAGNHTRERRRYEEETLRAGTAIKEMAEQSEELAKEIESVRSEAMACQERLLSLERLEDSITAAADSSDDGPQPPSITDAAAAILYDIVEKKRESMKAFRLTSRSGNTITLMLDYFTKTDRLVKYQEAAVFAVETPVPEALMGTRIDAR